MGGGVEPPEPPLVTALAALEHRNRFGGSILDFCLLNNCIWFNSAENTVEQHP